MMEFPEKPQRLEEQFDQKQFPLNENPQSVKSLDYSLRPEFNKWCLSEQSIIQIKVTGEKNLSPLFCAYCDIRLLSGLIVELVETQKP